MRPFIQLTAGLWLLALSPWQASADTLAAVAGSYVIQPSSRIAFHVDQVGGGGIDGWFGKFSGRFSLDKAAVGRSSVVITLSSGSVGASQERVATFLRSNAVFDAAEYPEISFRSTAVRQTGADTAEIDGLLTARGRTRPATFRARLKGHKGGSIAFTVTGEIRRAPYGMDVGAPIYSNVVRFDMELQGARR